MVSRSWHLALGAARLAPCCFQAEWFRWRVLQVGNLSLPYGRLWQTETLSVPCGFSLTLSHEDHLVRDVGKKKDGDKTAVGEALTRLSRRRQKLP